MTGAFYRLLETFQKVFTNFKKIFHQSRFFDDILRININNSQQKMNFSIRSNKSIYNAVAGIKHTRSVSHRDTSQNSG